MSRKEDEAYQRGYAQARNTTLSHLRRIAEADDTGWIGRLVLAGLRRDLDALLTPGILPSAAPQLAPRKRK